MSRIALPLHEALLVPVSLLQAPNALPNVPMGAMPRLRANRSGRPFMPSFLTLLVWLLVSGCGGDMAAPTPPPPPPPPPPSPVPNALQGSWVTVLSGTEERVTLTLGAGSYHIKRGTNEASGVITVAGDRIDFSGSSVCTGTGAYRWSSPGSSLAFSALTADACPGRSEVLAGYTYNKSG